MLTNLLSLLVEGRSLREDLSLSLSPPFSLYPSLSVAHQIEVFPSEDLEECDSLGRWPEEDARDCSAIVLLAVLTLLLLLVGLELFLDGFFLLVCYIVSSPLFVARRGENSRSPFNPSFRRRIWRRRSEDRRWEPRTGGMGTKILHEVYAPRSYSMREVNLYSAGNWPFLRERMSHDFFSWTPQISCDEFNRKVLRQTILKQEEVFRKQVCELHRLYRVQRICMEELKNTRVHSSEVASGLIESLGQWNGFPLTNGRVSPNVDHSLTHSCFGSRTRENAGPRKVFDLHLPADAYMDDDHDDERMIMEPKDSAQNHGTTHGKRIESGEIILKDLSRGILADLNEPIEECDEGDEISSWVHEIHHQKLQDHEKFPKLGFNFPVIQDDCKAKELTLRDVTGSICSNMNTQESSSNFSPEENKIHQTLNFPQFNQFAPQIHITVHSRSSSSSSQPKSTLESPATASLQSSSKIPRDMDLNLEPSCISRNLTDEKDEIQNSDLISNFSVDLGFETDPEKLLQSLSEIEIQAVETIQSLSLSTRSDGLRWLAEAVTIIERGLEPSSAMDSFEQEALKLKSIEIQEPEIKREARNPAAEETGSADLETKRSKRRRRRDFQREVLPAMATLSRQEVSEDLQILAAMARVTGNPWRKSGRGRRRPPAVPANVAEEETLGEEKRKRREVLSWGRTTRRCWKQRCSSGSVATELVVAMDG